MFRNLSIRSTRTVKIVAASLVMLAALAGTQISSAPSAHAATVYSTNSSSSRGSEIVSIAYRYLGYRYIYGGSSPRGFDCSGFTSYVYRSAGIWIGRTAAAQYYSGVHVSRANLQPGDLVFFANTYQRGISHAGIYLGNGKFINAANESTGVTISNLNSRYWASHYYGATRP
jgi:cell wall-associated NlpC family hydrolase